MRLAGAVGPLAKDCIERVGHPQPLEQGRGDFVGLVGQDRLPDAHLVDLGKGLGYVWIGVNLLGRVILVILAIGGVNLIEPVGVGLAQAPPDQHPRARCRRGCAPRAGLSLGRPKRSIAWLTPAWMSSNASTSVPSRS